MHAAEEPGQQSMPAEPFATVTTADGSSIAVHDLGGTGEPVVMVHATGFHGRVFRQLARNLPGFRCLAVDLRAHGLSKASPSWDGHWSGFAMDLLTVVNDLGLQRPYGIGHSVGGASLLLAEEAQPGMFRHLYCYEPIVMADAGLVARDLQNPMSLAASRRKEFFASKHEAFENYASKPPLCELAPACLSDYVEYGFEAAGSDGIRLRCRPSDEARVFANSTTHDAYERLWRVECPVEVACGGRSEALGEAVARPIADALTAAGAEATVTVFAELGHFGPLEAPEAVAAAYDARLDLDRSPP